MYVLNIALCDDNIDVLKILKFSILNYCENKNIELHINTFTHGLKLLNAKKHYDIIFLDIEMNEINGIELGKQIREYDKNVKIIYATAYPDYQCHAFTVHAFAYLVKPIESKDIYNVMDEVLLYFKNDLSKTIISFKSDYEILKLYVDNIIYFECFDRKIRIVCKDNVYYCSYKLSYLIDKMKSLYFISPHKSFLINMLYINHIKGYDITMTNGDVLPLSQKKAQKFRSSLNDFLQDTFMKI